MGKHEESTEEQKVIADMINKYYEKGFKQGVYQGSKAICESLLSIYDENYKAGKVIGKEKSVLREIIQSCTKLLMGLTKPIKKEPWEEFIDCLCKSLNPDRFVKWLTKLLEKLSI